MSLSSVCFQVIGDAVILTVATLIAFAYAEHGIKEGPKAELRVLFGSWLSLLVFSAFLVITIVSYVNVTASKLMVAAKEMHDETTFILEQTKESLRHDEEVSGPSVTSNTKGSMLEKLFAGYPEELDGFVIAARNGTILGANFNPAMFA